MNKYFKKKVKNQKKKAKNFQKGNLKQKKVQKQIQILKKKKKN
jgi:hypothetical protein